MLLLNSGFFRLAICCGHASEGYFTNRHPEKSTGSEPVPVGDDKLNPETQRYAEVAEVFLQLAARSLRSQKTPSDQLDEIRSGPTLVRSPLRFSATVLLSPRFAFKKRAEAHSQSSQPSFSELSYNCHWLCKKS
jgi:hypothetical protein